MKSTRTAYKNDLNDMKVNAVSKKKALLMFRTICNDRGLPVPTLKQVHVAK